MANKKATASGPGPEVAESTDAGVEAEDQTDLQDGLQQLLFVAAESYEKLSQTAVQLADQARGVYETSREYVREKPMGYVLGAFALGCVLGVLLGRD